MRIGAMVIVSGLLGAGVSAAEVGPEMERQITVCMNLGNTQEIALRARTMASEIFLRIGVGIDWRPDGSSCPVANGAIQITLSDQTLLRDHPGALAYAKPFEGTHIVVFYDRIRANHDRNHLPCLLAYVIAHEVTHILQRVSCHSQTGIMRASWNSANYADIQNKSLGFTSDDVDRIDAGFAWRQGRRAAADSTSFAVGSR